VSIKTGAYICCHGIECGFRGGIDTLRKRLGIKREWVPRVRYLRQRQDRERAERLARQFLSACQAERLKVYGKIDELNCFERAARELGPDCPGVWDALEIVCVERPRLMAAAILLAEAPISERRRWLEADVNERERIIDQILTAGGLYADAGRFVEVAW
jgi:hypothetical protein